MLLLALAGKFVDFFCARTGSGPSHPSASSSHFVPGLPHAYRVETGADSVPGLPHVMLTELRQALIPYPDYHM